MGSDIVTLMKIQLCEELRLGAVFHRQSSNRDALTYFASVALVAALFGFLQYMFMDTLAQMGLADQIPLIAAFISVTASLGFSFFRGTHAFVFDDYDLVMSMPVSSTRVALSRFLSVYLVSATIGLYLSLIGALAMTDHYSMGSVFAFVTPWAPCSHS